jgi:short-subunit dehydrogenase
MTRHNLEDQRILITGASSGIGRELARLMHARRCQLLLTARRAERLSELSRELADRSTGLSRLEILAGDITHPEHREHLVDTAQRCFGGLDVLVNNAGVGAVGPFYGSDPQRLRTLFEVNFFAPVELIRLCLPMLGVRRNGLIVNIGSVLAFCAVPRKSEYCASKFALRGFSDALRIELADLGIRVLSIHPNTTRSEFFDHLVEKQGPVPSNPLDTSPSEVAARIVRAIERERAETVLTAAGKALAWANWTCPRLTRRLLRRFG